MLLSCAALNREAAADDSMQPFLTFGISYRWEGVRRKGCRASGDMYLRNKTNGIEKVYEILRADRIIRLLGQ